MKKLRRVLALTVLLGLVSALSFGCAAGQKAEETPSPVASAAAPAPRDPNGDLLLIVDFQNVYLPDRDWACPSMPEAMENTIRILESENAPDCVMTKFIAPSEPTGRWQQYNEAYRDINEDPFLAELAAEMQPWAKKATVVEKSTFSSLDAPETIEAMEGKRAVVLAGVVADCCVLATMMDAIDMGYEVVYLYDCIAGSSPESEAEIRALAEIYTPVHTTILSSGEYLAAIAAGK